MNVQYRCRPSLVVGSAAFSLVVLRFPVSAYLLAQGERYEITLAKGSVTMPEIVCGGIRTALQVGAVNYQLAPLACDVVEPKLEVFAAIGG